MKKIIFFLLPIALILAPLPSLATGSLSLSQTSVSLNVGQNMTLTAYPPSNQIVNISSISNTYVALANISNNTITVYGVGSGSTQITLCTYDNTCGTVYVTVSGNNNYYGSSGYYGPSGQITFSQNNISLNTNQTASVTVYNSMGGSIYISNNSNSNVVSAYVSGTSINLTGINSGSATISVCGSNLQCNYLYVTVNGGNTYGQISFSQNNISLNTNQTASVTVYNSAGGSIYISNNSNSNTASAYISGFTIYLNGLNYGSSTITVCSNLSQCNYLYVTVGNGNTYGQIGLSQNSVSMNVGDTSLVTVYNSTNNQPYISSNSNSNIVSADLSGNLISLHALNGGYSSITVCAYSMSQCAYLNVTVSGGNSYAISFSQTSVNLSLNQSTNITIYSPYASYYISSNSNPGVVIASLSGQIISLYGQNFGSSILIICSNYGGQCGTIYAYVNQYSSASTFLTFSSTSLPDPIINQYYSAQILVSNGTAPYSFDLAMGFLPAGLSMSRNGLISGVPYSSGLATFTVIATDTYGRTSPNQSFTLTPSYTGTSYTGSGNVLGASFYSNGTLINDSGTVYLIYKNSKSAFASAYAFTGLGYSFSNVITASTANLNNSGYVITNPYTAHPWGSWIKNGSTIYFVDPSGLIPVPSYDVFASNSGSNQFVVNMNSYDWAKPILPVMQANDPRLR